MTACSVPGCDRDAVARSWCLMHYKRWRKHGDPEREWKQPAPAMDYLREAALSDTDDCIDFPFGKNQRGYGVVWHEGRSRPASRMVLILATGEDPPGLEAAHLAEVCHNPSCVNPRHLRWDTPVGNASDRLADETHHRGERAPVAKLTADQVREVRNSAESGADLARRFGVTPSAISSIRTGRTWGHLVDG